ncbi:MAG: acyl-[Blautia sp.]|nr:acyl-[acyl-carrier-protein] thioesterase [Blautia sp.]
MPYTFESRVRFSEAGENGRLTLPGILDYFQDCCTFQADSINQGQQELAKRNRVWVLSAWQIDVARFPEHGESIVTATYPYKLHGFIGLRNFTMDTKDGERLAWANSFWTFLNLSTGIPEKLREEDLEGYVLDEKLDMEYLPRKIALPKDMQECEPFEVQKHHLDANHHVNNGQYVHIAADYLPDGYTFSRLRAEYRQQGRLGDLFCPVIGREDNRTVVAILDKKGDPYAVAEFTDRA